MIHQHPLAYLLGMEGLALLRAWAGEGPHDEAFVRRRIETVRRLLDDPDLAGVAGVDVHEDATDLAYAEWAPSYDDPDNGLFDLDEPIIDDILGGLPVGRAVDVGCGTGRLTQLLARRGHTTTGIDASPAMLELARTRVPTGTFQQGEFAELPLADDAADLVVTSLALTHVTQLRPVYAEFARVLRPGGDLVVCDVHPALVLLGSTVKGTAADGRALLATTHRHSVGDHLGAALAAGFSVRRFEEQPQPPNLAEPVDPLPEPTREIGDWRIWPWTLLGWDPEAARSAWNNPAIMVWHLRSADAA